MRRVQAQIERYAASEATVLIHGATGTGKELAAQALHAASRRRNGPFVAVNCGAIAESLLESELFGYEEGAFTGSRRGGRIGLIEAARGGTLFLDEIGEMPLPLQTRLLRVLEEREIVRVGATKPIPVDLRIVSATHCELADMVAERRFRADLYYRLNVLRLDLPPLREREGDIALLAQSFLKNALGPAAPAWRDEALALLTGYDWPGNVRELRNAIDRLAVICADRKPAIDAELLLGCMPELSRTPIAALPRQRRTAAASLQAEAGDVQSPFARRPSPQALAAALARAGGHRGRAAEQLGVSRATLWRWLRDEAD
jgi:propionate catabolism operon transcriptional regulator